MIKIRCKTCQGSGRMMGGGMLYKDCESCEGEGNLYKFENEEEKKFVNNMEENIPKKRGRKPKIVEEKENG